MKFSFAAVFAALMMLVSVASASAEVRKFTKPKIDGYRLDWCYKFGYQCGEAAADRYCTSKGYDESSSFSIATDIGAETPTKILGTGQTCEEERCDGFSQVTCQRGDEEDDEDEEEPVLETKFYNKPALGGARLNVCVSRGVQCNGRAAARAFCAKNGFARVKSFGVSDALTQLVPTRYIASGRICKEGLCGAIKNLTCSE